MSITSIFRINAFSIWFIYYNWAWVSTYLIIVIIFVSIILTPLVLEMEKDHEIQNG